MVVDNVGARILWVHVVVNQANHSTYTDKNGNFAIDNVPEGTDTVMVEFVSCFTQKIAVN